MSGRTLLVTGGGCGADEVAHAVLWLPCDEASYTTGAILNVSGGRWPPDKD